MESSKESFIRLALDNDVLKFGEFKLKSGRISPYFFNAGLFYQSKALLQLGKFYANLLVKKAIKFDHLFGPAYKGLPLATTTAVALAEMGINSTVTFNRKEIKDHGEGGQLIGAPLSGNTIIIDDVITAGTAFRESQQLIKDNGGKLCAVAIALDRRERTIDNHKTIEEIENQGIKVLSIITVFDLIEYLLKHKKEKQADILRQYQEEYGY